MRRLVLPATLMFGLFFGLGCTGIVEAVLEHNTDENLDVDVQLGSQATLPDDVPIALDDYKMLRLVSHVVNKADGRRQTRVLIMSSLPDKEAQPFYKEYGGRRLYRRRKRTRSCCRPRSSTRLLTRTMDSW